MFSKDIQKIILKHLELNDCYNLCLVNKSWAKLFDDEYHWKDRLTRDFPEVKVDGNYKTMYKNVDQSFRQMVNQLTIPDMMSIGSYVTHKFVKDIVDISFLELFEIRKGVRNLRQIKQLVSHLIKSNYEYPFGTLIITNKYFEGLSFRFKLYNNHHSVFTIPIDNFHSYANFVSKVEKSKPKSKRSSCFGFFGGLVVSLTIMTLLIGAHYMMKSKLKKK